MLRRRVIRLSAAAALFLVWTGTAGSHPRRAGGRPCTRTAQSGVCGPYTYRRITNSNGYNTYTDQDMWAAKPGTRQTLTSTGPGSWRVAAHVVPAGGTAVQTYPNVQQLFNDWTGRGWNGTGRAGDTPITGLSSLRSSFAESMPHNSRTVAEAGYDIWLSHIPKPDSNEIMIWVDNVNRGTGGASQIGRATIDGQAFTILQYGGPGGEIIFSLNRSERMGTVDILPTLTWLISHHYEPRTLRIGQIEFGWEICSETTPPPGNRFSVSRYQIRSVPLAQHADYLGTRLPGARR